MDIIAEYGWLPRLLLPADSRANCKHNEGRAALAGTAAHLVGGGGVYVPRANGILKFGHSLRV